MTEDAFDSLLSVLQQNGDARLLGPALDLATTPDQRLRLFAAAAAVDLAPLDAATRRRFAAAALDADDPSLALRFAEDIDVALEEEVRALIGLGRLDGAENRYRAAVAANPALEVPELAVAIASARSKADDMAPTNILAFNRARGAPAGGAIESAEIESARLSFVEAGRIGFADVGGHDDVKKQIHRRIIAPFQKPALFARFRRKAGGGVLLYGPPGCGKTLLARATAGECGARFINVPVTDVLDKYVGEPERKLAAIFEDARRDTPAVLFFDEIEALAGKRGHQSTQHEIGVISTFLAELDGFAQNNQGVLILAATNMPWAVDAAFRRSGRFDRLLFVPPPDRDARHEIIRLQLDGRPVATDLELDRIVAETAGFSGADLQNLVDTAADFAIEESVSDSVERPIDRDHFAEALREVKATTAEWLTTARNFTKYGNTGGQYDEVADFLKKYGK
jgi:ATP-dependent 26S proteasome regulatory subunit